MYLPYLRGKQFELIALRELSELLHHNSEKVSPIIEPVKDSATIKSTIRELIDKNINFTLIINPQVGTFRDIGKILEMLKSIAGTSTNFQIGVIFNGKQNRKEILDKLRDYKSIVHSLTLVHYYVHDDIKSIIDDLSSEFVIKYNVINFGKINRRYSRNFPVDTLVELDDYFISQTRNSDYLTIDDSAFSEEHLYYLEEGFIGFSDFLSVGENYSDSGFLPYAIAIHISYGTQDSKIRIKHFVSDSNDDNSDIAGKFDEAINKLIIWCDETGYTSIAIEKFRELHENGHFPGLGTLKKLSIINHIALIVRII
jgi:hypothetical protein